MTGAVLPDGADAVIPVEDTDQFLDERHFNSILPDFVKIYKRGFFLAIMSDSGEKIY